MAFIDLFKNIIPSRTWEIKKEKEEEEEEEFEKPQPPKPKVIDIQDSEPIRGTTFNEVREYKFEIAPETGFETYKEPERELIEKKVVKREPKTFEDLALKLPEVNNEIMTSTRAIAPAGAAIVPDDMDIIGGVKVFGQGLKLLPKQVASRIVTALQGSEGADVIDKDWGDRLVEEAQRDINTFSQEVAEKYEDKKIFPGIPIQELAQFPQNVAYSISSMGTGAAVGVPTAMLPIPGARAAAYTIGMGASGKMAYEMTSYEIMQEYLRAKNEEMMKNRRRPITKAEQESLRREFDSLAKKHGLWEAIPEAIGQAAGFSIFMAPLKGMLGGRLAARIVTKLSGIYGEELLTETITELGQRGIRAEAGLPGGKEIDWTNLNDWMMALRSVAPQVFLLTTSMAGTGGTIVQTKQAINALDNKLGKDHPQYNKFKNAIQGLGRRAKAKPISIGLTLEEVGEKPKPAKEIPKELAEEVQKYDSAEEFIKAKTGTNEEYLVTAEQFMNMGKDITYGGTKPGTTKQEWRENILKPALTNFYNQVTGKAEPEVEIRKEEEIPEEKKKKKPATLPQLRKYGKAEKPAPFVRKRETTLLKERIKNIARGFRKGRVFAKKDIKSIQNELVDLIDKSELELKDKAKFNRTIKNIQTVEQLQKNLPEIQSRIAKLEEAEIKRTLTDTIKKELKYTKPVKKGERRVGKYDYEKNKLFTKLRDYNKLTQEEALKELNEMPKEDLSEQEKIKSRFLSYKANGAKSSAVLHEQILADIREMKRIGREAKDEADFNKKIEKQKRITDVLNAIEKQKPSKTVFKQLKTLYTSSVANLYSTMNAMAGKKMADKYDYGIYQTNAQIDFNDRVNKVKETTKEIYDIKTDRELNKIFLDKLAPKEFEITDNEGLTQEINRLELMNIYNGLKNDLLKERYYKHFGQEQVESLLQNLSPQDAQLADLLMEEIQEYRDVLNQRSIEISGRDLGFIENYWPAKSEYQAEFFDDIRIQGEIPSAMKKRTKSSNVVPQMANAWVIFQRYTAQAEHIKTISRKYEELKNVFSDRRVKIKIKNKYGDKAYESLMNHIEVLSLNKQADKLDVFSGVYNMMLNNWVKAKVVSPTVFARQMISSIYSVEKIGIKNYLKYEKDVIKHPKKTFKWMWNNVPFMRYRFNKGFSEALQDVIKGTNDLKVGMDSITKYTTISVRGGDVAGIVLNGYPIIKTALNEGKTMEEALEEFQKFTDKTQQSPTQANLSSPQRMRNAFARTFFRFKNTLNQLLRRQVDANIQFINNDISAKKFATKTFLYSIYSPAMYVLIGYFITQGWKGMFDREEEEKTKSLLGDILQQIIIQPFQTLPLLDATMETAYSEARKRITGKGYYLGRSLFNYPLLDSISTAWSKLTKKEPSAEDFLKVMSILQEPATGIPTETILRYYRYATEEKKEEGFEIPDIDLDIEIPEEDIEIPEIEL